MSVIVDLLDRAASKRAAAAEVAADIRRVAGDLLSQQEALEGEAAALVKEAKEKARFIPPTQAHTLVGRFLQLVWNPAKIETDLDPDKVKEVFRKYGVPESEWDGCFTSVEVRCAYWGERKVGKGK